MAGAVLRFLDYFDSVSGREIPCVPFRRDRGKTSGIQIFAAVCGTTIALALSSSPAWPEPGEGGMLADAPTLGLADVGSQGTLAFYGAEGTVLLTVPVPEGLVPAELTAVVEIPVNMATGTLTVAQRSHALSDGAAEHGPGADNHSTVGGIRCRQRDNGDSAELSGADRGLLSRSGQSASAN